MFGVILIIAATLTAAQDAPQAPSSAVDRAARRLSALLEPGAGGKGPWLIRETATEKSRGVPMASLPLSKAESPAPALPPPPRKRPELRGVAEESPPLVGSFWRGATLPVAIPSSPLVRLWSWDSDGPLPLPLSVKAAADRASLADPSLEASVAAAAGKVAVSRVQPTPFQPMNLPNPFEHAEAVRQRQPVEEQAMPPLTTRPY